MHRSLIIARMNPADADGIAQAFRESDDTDLPHLIGAQRRTLFRFHDLYLHLIEASDDITPALYENRANPLFTELHERLLAYIKPYDPAWAEPKHAMAEPFYTWQAS